MSGLVVFFSMVHSGGAVRVCREFMKFGSSLMCVIWHSISSPQWLLQLRSITLDAHPLQNLVTQFSEVGSSRNLFPSMPLQGEEGLSESGA